MQPVRMTMQSKISFTNQSSDCVLLIIEPWAEEFRIQPKASVEILASAKGTPEGYFEIEYNQRGIAVHAWNDCVLTVMSDGRELAPNSKE
jgi:hypothetical protein